MFKKTKLAAAMLAVVATSAQAVHVSPVSTGQVVIYPYYNVNNGFQTQISLVNSTTNFKAVKIRFRESDVSNDTLDFNIYMSPQDVWTATVRKKGDKANLITSDTTCTLPPIPANGVDFISAYDETSDADAREGYIEVIEMGRIIERTYEKVLFDPETESFKVGDEGLVNPFNDPDNDITSPNYNPLIVVGLKHGVAGAPNEGVPLDCTVVSDAWINGGFSEGGANVDEELENRPGSPVVPYTSGTRNWETEPTALRTPTGGLFGNTILLNTETGSAYVIDPVYVSDYAANDYGEDGFGSDPAVLNSRGAQHYLSDDQSDYLLPSLASGNVLRSDKRDSNGRGVTEVVWSTTQVDYGLIDFNVAPNTKVPSGKNPFPMAHALQIQSFAGEFFIEEYFDAATDWMVTFPMKKHGIFSGYWVYRQEDDAAVQDQLCGEEGVRINDEDTWTYCLVPLPSTVTGNAEDVQVAVLNWDREEVKTEAPESPPGFSPPIQDPVDIFSLTREVNILAVSLDGSVPDNNVLGSDAAQAVKTDHEKGWAHVIFNDRYDLLDYDSNERYHYYHGGVPSCAFYSATRSGSCSIGSNSELTGVPTVGAAATRGDIDNQGSATVGETFPLQVTSIDDDPAN